MTQASGQPAVPPMFDLLCDAEQLLGIILATELVMEQVSDDRNRSGFACHLISRQDKRTVAALLRSARQLAENMEAQLGRLA
jgi:hypothetical protein